MVEVLFIYEGQLIIIQCNLEDKMKDIINKFKNIMKIEDYSLFYIYNGEKINEEFKLNQIENDINIKKINILVYKNKKDDKDEKEVMSSEIICPECKENILINIKDYKINLFECKNGHKIENILLNDFEKLQKIDLSKIICNECYKYNKIINEEFYVCNDCGINLCPLCKFNHDKNHNIINHNDKKYICKKHNDRYIKYCKKCKENICFLCINEHNNHNIIDLINIIPNKDELLKNLKYLNEIIDKFKNSIKEMDNILNKVLNYIEIYYKIISIIIKHYNNKNRSYENYYNLNEIKNSNNIIINDLTNIINKNNISNNFQNITEMYYKIIRTKKIKIYENGDKYIGEFVNDIKDGKGILYYNKNNEYERNRYDGDFKDDKIGGKGILYWNNGDRYKGEFKDDKKEGKGIYYCNDGVIYKGDFKDGIREGKGILYWNNGDIYEGDYKSDIIEGKGIYYYNNGDIYKGELKDGKSEGKGILYYNDGDRYEGNFRDDIIEGKGVYYYNDGDRYEGDFKDGKKEGKGVYYYNDGEREMGDYINEEEIGIHVKLNIDGKVIKYQY